MIEVVFSESACGSIRQACSFGSSKFRSGVIAVILDNSTPSQEEVCGAKRRAEEQAHRKWEQAIPLGGNPGDVYCFDLAWSVGNISDLAIGSQRYDTLKALHAAWPLNDTDIRIEKKLRASQDALSTVLRRVASGEDIRIWYSHNPDEFCGMHWLMTQLHPLRHHGQIYTVQLPVWEYAGENNVIMRIGWGEIAPDEWSRYLSCQELVQPAFINACAMHWSSLQAENAPVRIVLNGQLQSAPADIYDSFILREIDAQPQEFPESHVIGNILGKYQLGISDGWIFLRIEEMIRVGRLHILSEAPENRPIYCRMLVK